MAFPYCKPQHTVKLRSQSMPCTMILQAQELSDMIIDFLHNDVAALCSASLVRKSWLPASRFHLFSAIEFRYRDKVHVGLEVICAEASTVPPYIRHLKIIDEYEREFANEVLLRLPPLNNLRNLSLDLSMSSLTLEAKKCLNIMARNLTSLSFCHFTVRKFFSPDHIDQCRLIHYL